MVTEAQNYGAAEPASGIPTPLPIFIPESEEEWHAAGDDRVFAKCARL